MIQPHGPSFGLRSIAGALLGKEIRVQDLEQAYAERVECPGAVWLPSARAGICWALRASIAEGTPVRTSAFNCPAVHEAVVRSGGRLEPVDAAGTGFLMDLQGLDRETSQSHATVLSAVYGHGYPASSGAPSVNRSTVFRVMDLAMSAPEWELLRSLGDRDFAVISFSIGKCMEAGFGAIGLTRDVDLARNVRRLRDAGLTPAGFSPLLSRWRQVTLRTLLASPRINALAKAVRSYRPKNSPVPPRAAGIPSAWMDGTQFEGAFSSTRLDLGLAWGSLIHADAWKQKRLDLARRYAGNLNGARGILLPESSPNALSHYTIRVPGPTRTQLRQRLYDAGISTSTLWRFPTFLEPDQFPNAHRLSLEVVNLPLSVTLSHADVDRICEALRRFTA